MRAPNNMKGFSLLEVMVALAITAMIVALVSLSFGGAFRAHNRAMAHLEMSQTMSQAVDRTRSLLQTAYISPNQGALAYTRFETLDTDRVTEPYDAITFTTLAHKSYKIDAHESEINEITLFTVDEPPMMTEEGEEQFRRLKVRVGGDINSRFEVEGGLVYTLADHVTTFQIEYMGVEADWKTEWDPLGRGLPCVAKVTIGLRTEQMAEEVATFLVPFELTEQTCEFEDERPFED